MKPNVFTRSISTPREVFPAEVHAQDLYPLGVPINRPLNPKAPSTQSSMEKYAIKVVIDDLTKLTDKDKEQPDIAAYLETLPKEKAAGKKAAKKVREIEEDMPVKEATDAFGPHSYSLRDGKRLLATSMSATTRVVTSHWVPAEDKFTVLAVIKGFKPTGICAAYYARKFTSGRDLVLAAFVSNAGAQDIYHLIALKKVQGVMTSFWACLHSTLAEADEDFGDDNTPFDGLEFEDIVSCIRRNVALHRHGSVQQIMTNLCVGSALDRAERLVKGKDDDDEDDEDKLPKKAKSKVSYVKRVEVTSTAGEATRLVNKDPEDDTEEGDDNDFL